jgi:YidB-like protein
VEAAIDPKTINELSSQTGLSREELLERIARDLPDAVDKKTPNGQLPGADENTKPREPNLLDPVPPERNSAPSTARPYVRGFTGCVVGMASG